MSQPIQLSNVTKTFGKHKAMDSVNYEVPSGVVFALLGENGAGKTTTIRTLLGLEKPDSGSAEVLGMPSSKRGIEIRRQIGYVPEQPTLYEWMTVDEIGWFTAGFYSEGYLKTYYEHCEQFGLPLKRKIKQLSKGMKAKVSLSLAMSHKPELLILDEPTSGLDTMVRRSFLESMVDVAASGRTVFLSSHQIPEVERVADIVAIMNQGKVLVCESLESLKARLEQWTITFADGAMELPSIDAEILHSDRQHRRVQLTLSNPKPEQLWQLRENSAITEVDVSVPSLEEIFIMYLSRNGDGETARAVASSDGNEDPVQFVSEDNN